MEFKNEHLKKVQYFVPEGFQKTAESFYNYLKSLPYKRIDFRYFSLAVAPEGLQIIDYAQHATSVDVFTWRAVKQMLLNEYVPENVKSPRLLELFNQLDGAF